MYVLHSTPLQCDQKSTHCVPTTENATKQSGINTEIYSAHSTRAASVSKASNRQVSIDLIMENAGWKSADTFRRFYNKPIARGSE